MRRLVMGLAGIVMAGGLSLSPSPAQAETTICTAESIDELLECEPGWAVNINFMHWRMYRGHNCTNYVAWRLTRDGVTEPDYLLGNAEDWADRAEDHDIPVNSTPAVGAVGTWSGRNHLVYVERVGDTWLQLSEDSWSQKRFRRYVAYRGDRGYPTKFIHFPGAIRGATPKVSGTPMVGEVLTAHAGVWTPSGVRLSYTWLRDGVVIGGARGRTYRLVEADATRQISVAVTGRLPDQAPRTASSDPTARVLAGTITPGTPSISGYPIVGRTLTADPGTWSPSELDLAYQWYSDGQKIPGATGRTWKVGKNQRGTPISVRVIGYGPGYRNGYARSEPTFKVVSPGQPLGEVVAGAPQMSAPPTMVVGDTLKVTVGTWSPAPVETSVQWFRGNAPIPGATRTTYRLRSADLGKLVRVEIAGRRPYFTPARTRTAAPDIVYPRELRPAVAPAITGTGLVGTNLSVNPGTWIPGEARTSVQWTRDGKIIPGATKPGYRVGRDDLRHSIGANLTTKLRDWPQDRRSISAPVVIRTEPHIRATVGPGVHAHAKRLTISVRALGEEQRGTVEVRLRGRVIKTVRLSSDEPTTTNFTAKPGSYALKLVYRGPSWLTSASERIRVTIS